MFDIPRSINKKMENSYISDDWSELEERVKTQRQKTYTIAKSIYKTIDD